MDKNEVWGEEFVQPGIVTPNTYGDIDPTVDYVAVEEQMWEESTAYADECARAWEVNREARSKGLSSTGPALDFERARLVVLTAPYTAACFLLLAKAYCEQTEDESGAELIRRFAREFSRRESTLI